MSNNFLNTLKHQPCSSTPIWLMRQAGRYLPEYRKTREQAGSFLNLCKNPELATEVTLQPLRRFALDAAILFSDILVIPEAMGMELFFTEGEGPKFTKPLAGRHDIEQLINLIPEHHLAFVMQTIRNLKQELPLNFPLIGFSGSPWTLACYMLEGGSSKNYEKIKQWLYLYPDLLHQLLTKLALAVANYLIAQLQAGVDTIMIFDSWGGVLTQPSFLEFSHNYLNQVLHLIKAAGYSTIPSISFTKGGGMWIKQHNLSQYTALGMDWSVNLGQIRQQTDKILQGNLDPVLLSVATPKIVQHHAKLILDDYYASNHGSFAGLIFNLGHGILPTAKPDNVSALVDFVHNYTQQ